MIFKLWQNKHSAIIFIYFLSVQGKISTEENSRPLMQHLYSSGFSLQPQDMKARTLPLMTALQMGQWRRLAAQSPHTTRWPQGMKTMDTSLSMHTLQVLSSCSCLSSSSGLGSFTVGETTYRETDERTRSHCAQAIRCVWSVIAAGQSNGVSAAQRCNWLWNVSQAQKLLFPANQIGVDVWPFSLMGVCVLTFPALEPCLMSGSEGHKH